MTKRKRPNRHLEALQSIEKTIEEMPLSHAERQEALSRIRPFYTEKPKTPVHYYWGEQVEITDIQWQAIAATINRELVESEQEAIQQTLNRILTFYKNSAPESVRTQTIKAELIKITKQQLHDVVYVLNLSSFETRQAIDILFWEQHKHGIDTATPSQIQDMARLALANLEPKPTRKNRSYQPLLVQNAFRLWAILGNTDFQPTGCEKEKKTGGIYQPAQQSFSAFVLNLAAPIAATPPHLSDINKIIRRISKQTIKELTAFGLINPEN